MCQVVLKAGELMGKSPTRALVSSNSHPRGDLSAPPPQRDVLCGKEDPQTKSSDGCYWTQGAGSPDLHPVCGPRMGVTSAYCLLVPLLCSVL